MQALTIAQGAMTLVLKSHHACAGSNCQPVTLRKSAVPRPQGNLPATTKATMWKEALLLHTGLETVTEKQAEMSGG